MARYTVRSRSERRTKPATRITRRTTPRRDRFAAARGGTRGGGVGGMGR